MTKVLLLMWAHMCAWYICMIPIQIDREMARTIRGVRCLRDCRGYKVKYQRSTIIADRVIHVACAVT